MPEGTTFLTFLPPKVPEQVPKAVDALAPQPGGSRAVATVLLSGPEITTLSYLVALYSSAEGVRDHPRRAQAAEELMGKLRAGEAGIRLQRQRAAETPEEREERREDLRRRWTTYRRLQREAREYAEGLRLEPPRSVQKPELRDPTEIEKRESMLKKRAEKRAKKRERQLEVTRKRNPRVGEFVDALDEQMEDDGVIDLTSWGMGSFDGAQEMKELEL